MDVERNANPHAIVLVPDITLLGNSPEFGGALQKKVAVEYGTYLQILDPQELFRIAQAAAMIHAHSKHTTLLEAFDAHIFSRMELATKHPTPSFRFVLQPS